MKTIMAIINERRTRLDVEEIRRLRAAHPSWHRTRLSKELCERWDWRGANGAVKDMACRELLLRLERSGLIELPARRTAEIVCSAPFRASEPLAAGECRTP